MKYIDEEKQLVESLQQEQQKEELTEFEEVLEMMMVSFSNSNLGSDVRKEMPKQKLHNCANRLLDLARKEIEKETSGFKPKFTYNEKDYSELGNKLIEFRNNTPLFSVSYRDGEGRKIILYYEKEILNLARKEFESERDRTCEEAALSQAYGEGYEQGKQDALKDLPKWKKSTLPIPDEEYPTGFNGKYFCYKGYCVDYEKLFETLPKEETDE